MSTEKASALRLFIGGPLHGKQRGECNSLELFQLYREYRYAIIANPRDSTEVLGLFAHDSIPTNEAALLAYLSLNQEQEN